MIAAIVGADPDTFNYFAELETSNKCVGWVKDHLALDEIGVFLKKYGNAADSLEQTEFNLYDYLEEAMIQFLPALTVLYLLLGFTATDARLKTLMPQVCSLTLGLKQAKQNLYVRLLREFASI